MLDTVNIYTAEFIVKSDKMPEKLLAKWETLEQSEGFGFYLPDLPIDLQFTLGKHHAVRAPKMFVNIPSLVYLLGASNNVVTATKQDLPEIFESLNSRLEAIGIFTDVQRMKVASLHVTYTLDMDRTPRQYMQYFRNFRIPRLKFGHYENDNIRIKGTNRELEVYDKSGQEGLTANNLLRIEYKFPRNQSVKLHTGVDTVSQITEKFETFTSRITNKLLRYLSVEKDQLSELPGIADTISVALPEYFSKLTAPKLADYFGYLKLLEVCNNDPEAVYDCLNRNKPIATKNQKNKRRIYIREIDQVSKFAHNFNHRDHASGIDELIAKIPKFMETQF